MQILDLKPESALAQKKLSGMILLCYENERPLKGMIGYLDWCFNGHFSKLLKEQVISGKKDESVYVPLLWNGHTYSFLIMGAGPLQDHGQTTNYSSRPKFSKSLLDSAIKKMNDLKLEQMGLSKLDWQMDTLNLEVPNLWILN